MRGYLPASRAPKRQRRRWENEPQHCRACGRAAPWSAKQAGASSNAGTTGCELAAPCGAAVSLDYFTREKVPLAHTPPAVQPSSAQVSLSLRMIFVL
jgi:hypothetical protein